jgi:RNA polymerase sigma factor (sigma-70 family)
MKEGNDQSGTSYERVWLETRPRLLQVASALACADDAEDVVQEVYLSLFAAPKGLRPDELRRWLMRVTTNQCRQEHRRLARWRRAFRQLSLRLVRVAQGDHARAIEQDQERQAVRTAMDGLKHELRASLAMRYFLDMDSEQIGEILNADSSTVRSWLRQGRLALAEALLEAGYGPEE